MLSEESRARLRSAGLVTLAVVFLALAVGRLLTAPRSAADRELDRPAYWICTVCGASWSNVMRDVVRHPNEAMGLCPLCKEYTGKRALACPQCGGILPVIGHGTYPPRCLHCNASLYTEVESCTIDISQIEALTEEAVKPKGKSEGD